MNISTEDDFIGLKNDHPWATRFMVLAYKDATTSLIPHGFLTHWLDTQPEFGSFYIGKCSGFGTGSTAKYDSNAQKLIIGRYVAGGQRVRFVLNGQHETNTISMALFSAYVPGMQHSAPPQYGDTVLKNDIWIGDEAMILGGATIENGCVIGARSLLQPNFTSEPFGVYVGSPARLLRFRFSEKIREALLDLAWWELPVEWVKQHNQAFLQRLNEDEAKSLALIAELKSKKVALTAA